MNCKHCSGEGCAHCDYARGGEVKNDFQKNIDRERESRKGLKGVHPGSGGSSDAGAKLHVAGPEAAKHSHKRVLNEIREMPNPKLEGMAEGGEVEGPDDDNELQQACCDEFMSALEQKDKKGALDSLRALILSCKE